MLKALLLALTLSFSVGDAQLTRMLLPPAFRLTYTGTTSGEWVPTAGQQLPFFNAAGGTWTFTVNRPATITLYTASAGGYGGSGGILTQGSGGSGGAANATGIVVNVAPGKTYTAVSGGYPGGNTTFTNTTDATVISSLTGGGNAGTAAGTVVTGAGTAGGLGASINSGGSCLGGGEDGGGGSALGGGGRGGEADDGGTGPGCGGAGAGGVGPLPSFDGFTGSTGGYGVSATICGQNVGGGGGGGGAGSSFGGAGFDNRYLTSGQAGIVCLQFTSAP